MYYSNIYSDSTHQKQIFNINVKYSLYLYFFVSLSLRKTSTKAIEPFTIEVMFHSEI